MLLQLNFSLTIYRWNVVLINFMQELNKKIDVSIIIVNYNTSVITINCLESIFNFTIDVNYEIILIDNNSIDPFFNEIEKKYFSQIRIIKNNTNRGFAAANNQGITIAKGKYILFLNNDTLFIENTLKTIFDFAEKNIQPTFIGCKLLNNDRSHQNSIVQFPSLKYVFFESFFFYKIFKRSEFFNKYSLNYTNITKPISVNSIKGAFMFCNGKIIKKLKGFDERFYFYGEESDLCKRFKDINGKIIFFPNSSIIHLEGSSTNYHSWFKYKNQANSKIKYFQKHFTSYQKHLIILLHFIGLFLRVVLYLVLGIIKFDNNLIIKSYYFLRQIFVYPKNEFGN